MYFKNFSRSMAEKDLSLGRVDNFQTWPSFERRNLFYEIHSAQAQAAGPDGLPSLRRRHVLHRQPSRRGRGFSRHAAAANLLRPAGPEGGRPVLRRGLG